MTGKGADNTLAFTSGFAINTKTYVPQMVKGINQLLLEVKARVLKNTEYLDLV